jgi:hypothetical protein
MPNGKRWRNFIVPISVLFSAVFIWFLNRRWDRRFELSKSEDVGIKDAGNWLHLGRHVVVQSVLDCPPEKIWEQVRTSGLLLHVIWPILAIKTPDNTLPAIWKEGDEIETSLYAFGIIPLGKHRIKIQRIGRKEFEFNSKESGQIAQIWNHRILLENHIENKTLYTDDVEIYAGKITGFVAFFAKFFYRYRQTRWQKLAKAL